MRGDREKMHLGPQPANDPEQSLLVDFDFIWPLPFEPHLVKEDRKMPIGFPNEAWLEFPSRGWNVQHSTTWSNVAQRSSIQLTRLLFLLLLLLLLV